MKNKKRFRIWVIALEFLLLFVGVWVGFQLSHNMVGLEWKKKDIMVYNQSHWQLSTAAAIDKWNQAQDRHKFVLTDNPKQANVIIRENEDIVTNSGKCDNCRGKASVGRSLVSKSEVWLLPTSSYQDQMLLPEEISIIAHELGHILGLEHSQERCRLMSEISHQCVVETEGMRGVVCGPMEKDLDELGMKQKESSFTSQYVPICSPPKSKSWELQRKYYAQKLGIDIKSYISPHQQQEDYLMNHYPMDLVE